MCECDLSLSLPLSPVKMAGCSFTHRLSIQRRVSRQTGLSTMKRWAWHMSQLAELTPFLPLCGTMATTMINKVKNDLSNIFKKLCQQLTDGEEGCC